LDSSANEFVAQLLAWAPTWFVAIPVQLDAHISPEGPSSTQCTNFALLATCRTVFDLPLELKDKKTTALRITLPPHFPQVNDVRDVQDV
jgi:hypothetical protein